MREVSERGSPYELSSNFLASPLRRPLVVPYIMPDITSFKEFSL